MDAVYGHSNGSDGLPEKLDDSQRAALDREETGRSGFVFVLGRLTVRCTCYRPLHVSMTEFRDLQKSLLDGGEGRNSCKCNPQVAVKAERHPHHNPITSAELAHRPCAQLTADSAHKPCLKTVTVYSRYSPTSLGILRNVSVMRAPEHQDIWFWLMVIIVHPALRHLNA